MNANIGMQHAVAALVDTYTPGDEITYGEIFTVSQARGANLSWERANGRFYGDDIELDNDNGILGYTIEFETAGLKDDIRAELLGETAGTGVYQITDDVGPDVGFGYVRIQREDDEDGPNATTYHGWWFHKLKFSLNNEETRTKERSVEWRVPTLTGDGSGVKLDNTGKLYFAEHYKFDTLAAAISFVDGHGTSTGSSGTTT